MKITTWNLWNKNPDQIGSVKNLVDQGIDVICLQEVMLETVLFYQQFCHQSQENNPKKLVNQTESPKKIRQNSDSKDNLSEKLNEKNTEPNIESSLIHKIPGSWQKNESEKQNLETSNNSDNSNSLKNLDLVSFLKNTKIAKKNSKKKKKISQLSRQLSNLKSKSSFNSLTNSRKILTDWTLNDLQNYNSKIQNQGQKDSQKDSQNSRNHSRNHSRNQDLLWQNSQQNSDILQNLENPHNLVKTSTNFITATQSSQSLSNNSENKPENDPNSQNWNNSQNSKENSENNFDNSRESSPNLENLFDKNTENQSKWQIFVALDHRDFDHQHYLVILTRLQVCNHFCDYLDQKPPRSFLAKRYKIQSIRQFQYIDIPKNNQKVRVFNTHLEIAIGPTRRIRQFENLVKHFTQSNIICGDFNIFPHPIGSFFVGWAASFSLSDYKTNERKKFEILFKKLGLKNIFAKKITYPRYKLQLDHILVSNNFSVLTKKIEKKPKSSDHYQLYCELI